MRRSLLIVLGGTVVGLGVWVGTRAYGEWRYRSELRQAAEEFNAKRYSEAAKRLAHLAHTGLTGAESTTGWEHAK